MKINELVTLMSQNKNKLLKAEQIQAFLKKELNVKEYISIKEKKELVEDIVDACILYADGIFKFDDIDKYICFTMKVIEAYTDLELSSDMEDDYDMLCEAKLLNAVIDTFKKEYDEVNILLQMKCDYVLHENTMEAQLGRFLENMTEKLDVLVQALSDQVNGFDINSLQFSAEDLQKLMKFMNIQK